MLFRLIILLSLLVFHPQAVFAAAPAVIVSIAPVHSAVCAVMEGAGTPELLLAPAVSVHDYPLRPSDMRRLAAADVLFWGGPELESFLPKAIEAAGLEAKNTALLDNPRIKKYRARTKDGDDRGGLDGHFWLSPGNMAAAADIIAQKLSELDPENAAIYQNNAAKFKKETGALSEKGRTALAPYASEPYVVYHDAYQYFEKEFGLNPLDIVSADVHHAAGAGHIRAVRDKIRQAGAACLFSEPQFSDKRVMVVAEDLPVSAGVLDPLGSSFEPGSSFYSRLMNSLIDSFVQCFQKLPRKV